MKRAIIDILKWSLKCCVVLGKKNVSKKLAQIVCTPFVPWLLNIVQIKKTEKGLKKVFFYTLK